MTVTPTRAAVRRRVESTHPLEQKFGAVDGLRAVVIASVVAYHSGWYTNGLFGVDLFFVLSGFLITLTLLKEHRKKGKVSLRNFYARRAKRLLPPLIIVLCATGLLVWGLSGLQAIQTFSTQAVSSLFYVANWAQILNANAYWTGLGQASPLSHMWSLSITEQFYLVWPPVLVLLLVGRIRRFRLRYAIVTVIAWALFIIGAFWVDALYKQTGNADRIYLGTDTHGIAVLAGVGAACLLPVLRGMTRRTVSWRTRGAFLANSLLGVAMAAAIVVLSIATPNYHAAWLYPLGLVLIALLGAGLTFSLTMPGLLTTLLSWRPLVSVGKVSYSIFLVHMPILWAFSELFPDTPGPQIFVVGLVFSYLLAAALHYIIAEPLRLRSWTAKGVLALILVGAATATLAFSLPNLYRYQAAHGTIRVLTLGDSLANDFATSLSKYGGSSFAVTDGGLGGCGILSPQATGTPAQPDLEVPRGCLPWQSRWKAAIKDAQPQVIVIDLAWDGAKQKINGSWTDLTDSALQERFQRGLAEVNEMVKATETQVLIANARASTPVVSSSVVPIQNDLLRSFVQQHPKNFSLLDLDGHLCPQGACEQHAPGGDQKLYIDDVHFSNTGLQYIAPWLAEAVKKAISE